MQGKSDASIDDKTAESLDGGRGNSDRGVVVRVLVDGDREDTEQGPTPDEAKHVTGQEEKEKSGPKAGRPKRKRPANRHYIKDETMRTLFGLLPFYGGDDGPMDQMVKATLASVGPNTIDVRNEAGDTLLILACQHACETQDYYTYTAVKYAKDAGHDAIVELLGGEEDGEGWVEVEEVYTSADAGEDAEESGPTGGLWIRHIDPQTELAYYMNDETGESWWETDLLAVAKEYLAMIPAAGGSGSSLSAVPLPPLGVREWLVQEQVRSWLVAIFSRADPLRVMEVDLVMQIGKADFKEMLKALVSRYGLREFDFLRKASSPKLEALGVSSLMPSEVELEKAPDAKPSPSPPEQNNSQNTCIGTGAQSQPVQEARSEGKHAEPLEAMPAAPIVRRHSISASASGGTIDGQPGGRDSNTTNTNTTSSNTNINSTTTNRSTLQRVVSSQHSLKRVDSPAVLRAEADKEFQEALSQHEKELGEERKRQTTILDEQRRVLGSLEEMIQKRETALAKAKEEAEEASSVVAKLQSALADDSSGQVASDALSEEIAQLKASVAAEKVRFSHMTEALEATKGSVEERAAKQRAQEEDRRIRLEQLRSENEEEVGKIRTDAAESLSKAEQAWETERGEMERELTEKVEQETALLKETVEGAAKVLSEAAATTKSASDAAKQGAAKVEEARAWMKQNAASHANSKQIDQTNKQLHTSLRREMERAKQLHNQIEDMKGQTRMYARVRPMDALEKEAGCKEVCLRDGKQTLALLTAAQQHWTFTHVFQNPSAEVVATTAGQTELHKEVAGLGTTLADGHNVLLMAVGASRSGKTLTLVGEPDSNAATGTCGFYVPEDTSEDGGGAATKAAAVPGATTNQARSTKKGKGKRGSGTEELGDGGGGVAVKATSLAGIFPRLLAETFATLNHRAAQCAFVVSVSAAAVSIPAAPDAVGSRGGVVESLLSPAIPPPPVRSGSSPAADEEQVKGNGGDGGGGRNGEKKDERDRDLPPRSTPEDDGMWGGAVAASSPQEVMVLIAEARSRSVSPSNTSAAGDTTCMREDKHFLSRVRVNLVNRSTSEASSCEMVMVELAEEKPGEAWPAALAEVVRAHTAATAVSIKGDEADGFLGMVKGCLSDTAKVVTLLCVSPADNHAEKTERVLTFGKACENSGEDGAAQLKDLKKELARLKKEAKGTKKTAPSQLPRPAGGKKRS
eukprot:g7360.t1